MVFKSFNNDHWIIFSNSLEDVNEFCFHFNFIDAKLFDKIEDFESTPVSKHVHITVDEANSSIYPYYDGLIKMHWKYVAVPESGTRTAWDAEDFEELWGLKDEQIEEFM